MKNQKAVTLVELLIVVVIIGILAAAAIPIFYAKTEQIYGERAISNIKMIVDAMKEREAKHGSLTGSFGSLTGSFSPYYSVTQITRGNPPDPARIDTNRVSDINANLYTRIIDNNFFYNINSYSTGTRASFSLLYEIYAVRIRGRYRGFYLHYFIRYEWAIDPATGDITPAGYNEGWAAPAQHVSPEWPWEPN